MANGNIINVLFVRAAREKSWDDLRRLLEKVEDVNVIDSAGNTALMYALANGNLGIADLLIECGANGFIPNTSGETALMWAAGGSNLYIVGLLLKDGVGEEVLNAVDNNGNTALMWAAGKSSDGEEIVRRLLDHGANVIATNKHRCTAFSMAMAKGNKKIADLLKSRGATG